MDHWADPWADDADTDSKPPLKIDLPTTQSAAPPAVLNGFLDDAQWGSVNRDEGWGDWASEPRDTEPEKPPREAPPRPVENEPWRAVEEVKDTEEPEQGISDASDSGTTLHPENSNGTDEPELEDDLSTHPSLSTSEASHTESVAESPRTSFEDERRAGKVVQHAPSAEHSPEVVEEGGPGVTVDTLEARSETQGHAIQPKEEQAKAPKPPPFESAAINPLLSQLFPTPEKRAEAPPAQDDPIFSTSARKAWYRLTRPQTMREYNRGGEDNNYVRVTWATSKIREDVNKIVSRWATEDRIAGRSHVGRVSFYWDQPVDPLIKAATTHSRKPSSITSVTTQKGRYETQTPVSDAPAAFNWSSPSAELDFNEKNTSSVPQSPALPIASPLPAPATATEEGGRLSLDQVEQAPSRALSTVQEKDSTLRILGVSPSLSQNDHQEAQTGRSIDNAPNDVSDDEEWGDMVQSPTLASSTRTAPLFESAIPSEKSATPSGVSAKTAPRTFQQPVSKHAAPIVRLQGVVSPTTAVFNAKPLIPAHIEQGPIGPHILRKTNRSPSATPEKPKANLPEKDQPPIDAWADADFSIFDSAPTQSTLPPVAPLQPLRSTSTASKTLPSRSTTPSMISSIPSQSRRSDDDEVVRNIISGLPDLSYMVKR